MDFFSIKEKESKMEKVNIGEKNTFPLAYAKIIVDGGDVGKAYRPSNGSEGANFIEEWCGKCAKSDGQGCGGCDITDRTMNTDPDDPAYPVEWNYREDGQPQCTSWVELIKAQL
jgi:hypothetical protein